MRLCPMRDICSTGGRPRSPRRVGALVGVSAVTEVRGDELRLTGERDAAGRAVLALPAGAAIPIDALAIDPVGYALDVPGNAATLVRKLPRDGALLGATSARLRGIGVGGSLPYLRHGDAVLPQALVKARFGEFWYRADAHGP
jgi:hypothetical protein